MTGIYKIQSILKPERIYIGSAINIKNRWGSHIKRLKKNKHENKRIQNHFNKYGIADLIFTVLLECDKESLLKTEQFFIDSYNPFFNIRKIAHSQIGCHWKISEIGRKNMSKGKIGNKNAKNKIPHNKGTHLTEDQKKQISIATKEGMKDERVREKIRLAKIGHKQSVETIEKKRKSTVGQKRSPETINNLKQAWVKRKLRIA